ncbi:MAG: hypothetical protein FJ288_00620 [Planctomycetes bacterium]|nr:hypothetical protein [Planctomycetota bacterium]
MPAPVLVGLVLLMAAAARADETLRLPATKDNSIVLVDREWRDNAGRRPAIRIKGNQHIVAMMFDVSAIEGRLVKSATLVCRKGDASIDGMTISTIMADWDELKSNALTSGMQAADGWGYPGARFPAVCGGNAFSLLCQAPSVVKDGQYRWQVEPDLVHALATGTAYGLALHEWSADYSRNPTILSREQPGKEPYLEVVLADGAAEPQPQPPSDCCAYYSGGEPEALRFGLNCPKGAFAFEVTVDGKPLPRWNIPFARAGTQNIPIRDVPYDCRKPVTVTLRTLNRQGVRSGAVTATAQPLAPKRLPTPDVPPVTAAGPPPPGLAVIPLEDKYDAAGKPVGDLPPDYQARNEVFDGRTIRLAAARGEVVGFQALIKGTLGREPKVIAAGAAPPAPPPGLPEPRPVEPAGQKVRVACVLPGLRVAAYRAVYVQAVGGRRIPDPLVPLAPGEEVALYADEAVPVCFDVYVPFDFAGTRVEGSLNLSDGRTLPVALQVRPFALPREAAFACEMNGYGLPDKASQFHRIQEIAYDHRVHANILYYSHSSTAPGSRKANIDMVMDGPAGDGSRRMDEKRFNDIPPGSRQGFWDDFAAVFGPYLSGSHFRTGWRGPVAPPGFYLPFHESWPLKVREFFSGTPDAYGAFKAKPVYGETFVNILRDFIARAAAEGWGAAGFQVYLNNKGALGNPGKAPWILDEPVSYWDYRALAYYADLVRQAKGEKCPVRIQYRIDISRPQFDRGQLAGKADLWVVSTSALHEYPRLVADRAQREGLRFWIYGSTNKVEETNRTVGAWVLDAYRGGASGVVPWQTVNKDGSAMTKADQLGLFIFAKDAAGRPVIRHSVRLAAYRRAEQDVEYLELLRRKHGSTPRDVELLLDHYVNLRGTASAAYAEDAAAPEYAKVTPDGLRRLREAAALVLAQP